MLKGSCVLTWVVACYEAFAFLLVCSAAGTAMWTRRKRRKDAFKVLKVVIVVLAGSGGLLGLLLALARFKGWRLP